MNESQPTSETTRAKPQLIQVDEAQIKDHLSQMVLETVEETLNALLEAEADRLCHAPRYQHSADRKDTRAGHYPRKLHPKAGEVELQIPKLRTPSRAL